MVNLKFIARKAGVSAQTVSNVINNKITQTSEETRKKILDLVEQYSYRPSKIAVSLRKGKTKTIALLVPDIVFYPVYPIVFDIMENYLKNLGFNILLYNTGEDINREREAVNNLISNKVDGIIFIRIIEKNPYINKLPKNIPLVACLRAFEYWEVPSVLTDNRKIGYMATDHLIKNGHRNIIHLAGNQNLFAHKERLRGHKEALETNKINFNKDYVIYCDYKGANLYKDILVKLKEINGYTAVFAYSDYVAINCIKALKLLGLKVADDISIVGVDNLDIGSLVDPPLTTIEQPFREISLKSAQLLIDCINNNTYDNKVITYNPKFIERESVRNIKCGK